MTPGPPCKICTHDERDAIERAMVHGKPDSQLAKQYGAHAKTMGMHRRFCIPETLAKARHTQAVKRGDFILGEALKLLEACQAVLDRAKFQHDQTLAKLLSGVPKAKREAVITAAEAMAASDEMVLRAAREVRPTLELLAKIAGDLQEGVSVNVHLAPDFTELKAAILKGLINHPEAFLDVKDALLEFMARRQEDGFAERVH